MISTALFARVSSGKPEDYVIDLDLDLYPWINWKDTAITGWTLTSIIQVGRLDTRWPEVMRTFLTAHPSLEWIQIHLYSVETDIPYYLEIWRGDLRPVCTFRAVYGEEFYQKLHRRSWIEWLVGVTHEESEWMEFDADMYSQNVERITFIQQGV